MPEEEERITAQELANKCAELAMLSEKSGFRTGAYLLKMACLEFIQQQDQAAEDPKDAA